MDLFEAAEATVGARTLRPYQRDILEAVAASKARRQLVQAATGTGKTVTFAAMPTWPALRSWLNGWGKWSMLVIAHREELIDQAADKIAAQNPDLHVSVEQGERYSSSLSNVVVASVQTLAAKGGARLERMLRQHQFRLVIVDEAHHATARTYRSVLAQLGFLPAELPEDAEAAQAVLREWDQVTPKDRLLVGVTATPNRSDAVGLGLVFQSMVYSYPLRKAVDDKWLVPIVAWSIETRQELDAVRTTAGEFNQRELADAVNVEARNRLALASWQRYAPDEQTLAFTVDVGHAHAVAATFKAAGVEAAAVSGETPKVERRQLLQAYTDGRVRVLANCMILTEGTDLPATGCVLHMKPTKSATLYEQMTGRGLRLWPGKDACIVIDLVDVTRKHSLLTAPVLFGLPPNLKANGKNLGELRQAYDEFREKYKGVNIDAGRKTLEELEAIARQVDVWNVPTMGDLGRGLTQDWMRLGDDQFRVRFPWGETTESVDVAPDLVGQWSVTASWRAHKGTEAVPAPVTLATGLGSAREALKAAEDYVLTQRGSALRLTSKDAPWKRRPASQKQIELLAKFKIVPKPGLTAGEASEMLSRKLGR